MSDKKINLCISNRCFVKCVGCYNNFCYDKEISVDSIVKFLKYMKKNNINNITISGGDPLARNDIVEILEKCIKLNFEINIDTVGLPIIKKTKIWNNDEYVEHFNRFDILEKINYIGIPIDGSTQEKISTFRFGLNNLFELQKNVLDVMEKYNVKICINTVVHKQNYSDIENIYNFIKKYNCVKKWQLFQYMPNAMGNDVIDNKFIISDNLFFKKKREINNLNESQIIIEFKFAKDRYQKYMLIDSVGNAYKIKNKNERIDYGNIKNEGEWNNILNNI